MSAGLISETIRQHLDSCGPKMVAVAFIKKDGRLRHMRINGKALLDSLVNSERGNKAAATRRQNHPNLKPVPEITRDGAQWRNVNLDTVLTVKAGGKLVRYRDIVPIGPRIYELVPIITVTIGREESGK